MGVRAHPHKAHTYRLVDLPLIITRRPVRRFVHQIVQQGEQPCRDYWYLGDPGGAVFIIDSPAYIRVRPAVKRVNRPSGNTTYHEKVLLRSVSTSASECSGHTPSEGGSQCHISNVADFNVYPGESRIC